MPAVNPRGFAGYFSEPDDPPAPKPKPVRQYCDYQKLTVA